MGAEPELACCSVSKLTSAMLSGCMRLLRAEDSGGAALILLDPEEGGELGQAFIEPGLAGVDPGVGEGVGEGGGGVGRG